MAGAARRRARPEPELVLPLAEERIRATKVTERRSVRLKKMVRTRPARVDQRLVSEDVVIERVPVGRMVDGPVPDRWEGDTLVVSLVEEVPTVRYRLREEIRITKKRAERRDSRTVQLRSEDAVVERSAERQEEPT